VSRLGDVSGSVPTTATVGPAPATADATDRWDYYRRLQELGEVVWDELRGAWLVTSHRLCKEVQRGDETVWRSAMAFEREQFLGMDWETYVWYQGGARRLNLLTGEEHARLHRWWMAAFSPKIITTWRENVLRPVADAQIDRFVADGRAELGRLADAVHIRVIAGTLGMPWDDDAWMDRWVQLTNDNQIIKRYIASTEVPAEIVERALGAAAEMREELLQWVRRYRSGEGDYLISMMWRDFPGLFESFDEEDVLANLKPAFETTSTRSAFRNAFYALIARPELRDAVGGGDPKELGKVLEETFRVYGGIELPRVALRDVQLGDVLVREGETAIPLAGAANVDPERFSCPYDIDTSRGALRDHLFFSQGPRACPGQNLARAEIEETLLAVLERLPNVRFDPGADPARYVTVGFEGRWEPLNVVFDA
jgi:cytochrome P450